MKDMSLQNSESQTANSSLKTGLLILILLSSLSYILLPTPDSPIALITTRDPLLRLRFGGTQGFAAEGWLKERDLRDAAAARSFALAEELPLAAKIEEWLAAQLLVSLQERDTSQTQSDEEGGVTHQVEVRPGESAETAENAVARIASLKALLETKSTRVTKLREELSMREDELAAVLENHALWVTAHKAELAAARKTQPQPFPDHGTQAAYFQRMFQATSTRVSELQQELAMREVELAAIGEDHALLVAAHEAELAAARETHPQQVSDHEADVASFQAQFGSVACFGVHKVQQELSIREAELAAAQEGHALSVAAHRAELATAQERHAMSVAAHKAELAAAQDTHALVVAAHKSELAAAREAHAQLVSAHESELAAARETHAQLVSAHESELAAAREAHAQWVSAHEAELSYTRVAHKLAYELLDHTATSYKHQSEVGCCQLCSVYVHDLYIPVWLLA
jgi:hypothetical protein